MLPLFFLHKSEDADDTQMVETKILQLLGETSAMMGELNSACHYYDSALDRLKSMKQNAEAKISAAEMHLLYSKALFDLGCYEADGDSARGSREHIDEALRILETVDYDDLTDDVGAADNEHVDDGLFHTVPTLVCLQEIES